jgi:hypothetical protein
MATRFGYINHLQAIIYDHLIDLDIECFRAMGSHMALQCLSLYAKLVAV